LDPSTSQARRRSWVAVAAVIGAALVGIAFADEILEPLWILLVIEPVISSPIFALVPAYIARKKGRSFLLWWIGGTVSFFLLAAVIFALAT
jgi:hypothetical protein